MLHHSTPEKGLLKDDDKWMPDMMDNLIHGITSKQSELQHTISDTAEIISGLNENVEVPDITMQIKTAFDKVHMPEMSLPFMQAGEIFRSSQNNYNTSNYDNRTVYAPVNVSINANINNDTDIRTIAQGIARETQKNLAGIGVYEE